MDAKTCPLELGGPGGCPIAANNDKLKNDFLYDTSAIHKSAEMFLWRAASDSIDVPKYLNGERTKSTIPSAQGGSWDFPSERQFYKAARLKGHGVDGKDMPSVVGIHNAVNEEAWRQVRIYENLHKNKCANPTLSRFVGKPNEPSPKAQLRNIIGYDMPFDRHDWVIDRCGKHIRYIVDFYDGMPTDRNISIFVDARPAVDTPLALIDRIRVAVANSFEHLFNGRNKDSSSDGN